MDCLFTSWCVCMSAWYYMLYIEALARSMIHLSALAMSIYKHIYLELSAIHRMGCLSWSEVVHDDRAQCASIPQRGRRWETVKSVPSYEYECARSGKLGFPGVSVCWCCMCVDKHMYVYIYKHICFSIGWLSVAIGCLSVICHDRYQIQIGHKCTFLN